jgi:hypothetical protein
MMEFMTTGVRGGRVMAALIGLAALGTWGGSQVARADEQTRVVVRPADNGQALLNPGMGWLHHHFDNTLAQYGASEGSTYVGENFPGMSVIYLRLAWAYVEPAEGVFCWSVIDAPAQRWIQTGRKIALRITNCESHDLYYATPRWVEKSGAKGYRFTQGKGVDEAGDRWEPKYDDPVFLAKLENFLRALAARYDGDPNVAFIDVGSIGVWGEGHTFHSTKLKYDEQTFRRHIDLYAKYFKRTQVVILDDCAHRFGEAFVDYARQAGMGLRDDSIIVYPFRSDKIAQRFWPTLPVALESQHYGMAQKAGTWKDGMEYLRAVEVYHASYVSCHYYPSEFIERERPLVDRINRRLGYRLQLRAMSWPRRVRVDGDLDISYTWCNAGVAPCYGGGHPAITLKDTAGGIAGVFVDEGFNVGDLAPTPTGQDGAKVEQRRQAAFSLIPPVLRDADACDAARLASLRKAVYLKPARYDLFVSVGSPQGTPQIALPLQGADGHRRYKVGSIDVEAPEPLPGLAQ